MDEISQKKKLIQRLQSVGYYRFSGYSYPFRETYIKQDRQLDKLDKFRSGTILEIIWHYYLFDRRLRLLITDAIERIEIAFRVCIAYEWADQAKISNPQSQLSNFSINKHNTSLSDRLAIFQKNYDRSAEDYAFHSKKIKGVKNVVDLPIWVLLQFSTFGNLHYLYRDCLKLKLRQKIAQLFGFPDEKFFASIIALLVEARNISAHHGRIWNRKWKHDKNRSNPQQTKMSYIIKDTSLPNWDTHSPDTPPKDSTAFLLTALHTLLQYAATTSEWDTRLISLITTQAPSYHIEKELGFPTKWQDHPLWTK